MWTDADVLLATADFLFIKAVTKRNTHEKKKKKNATDAFGFGPFLYARKKIQP